MYCAKKVRKEAELLATFKDHTHIHTQYFIQTAQTYLRTRLYNVNLTEIKNITKLQLCVGNCHMDRN